MGKNLVNTIYIMSKGRPECLTAKMLSSINYPGEWFIVCGDNDNTIPQYMEKWGRDKVLVFNWREWVDKTDLMDPFGVENNKPSGAAPARNAIHSISKNRGEKRHWQLDDDFPIFYDVDDETGKKIRIEDGELLYSRMNRIAEYGESADLLDVGIDGATLFLNAISRRKIARQVFGCHNLRSDDKFLPWRARMADDIVHAIDAAHCARGIQIAIKWFGFPYVQSAKKPGGNTDLYLTEGYIRKAGYSILADPICCRMVIDKKGPHIKMNYQHPKIINMKFQLV